MFQVPIHLTGKLQIFMTDQNSLLIWQFRMLSAIHSVEQPGYRLHNGGGVGWGEVINGGFGMVLDGTAETEARLRMMLHWDVNNGIARRSWARNKEAMFTLKREMERTRDLK